MERLSEKGLLLLYKDENELIRDGEADLPRPPEYITDSVCPHSQGSERDYFSEADYWWPDPDKKDGLPYIRRDGLSYPGAFKDHRLIMRRVRNRAVRLARAWIVTGDEKYSRKIEQVLTAFFLDKEKGMNPNLQYAQAIAGICSGRGIGIIDTIHITDIPFIVSMLEKNGAVSQAFADGCRIWFSEYLEWLMTSKNGQDESQEKNNHSVCFWMQAAVFAKFTGNTTVIEECRRQYVNRLLPQIAPDGSFPLELKRTKPYNYSAFVLDNLGAFCQAASDMMCDVWKMQTRDGICFEKALDFLEPYLLDKNRWPYAKDVEHYDAFPVRYSVLLFAGRKFDRPELIQLFKSLQGRITDEEALRNLSVRAPECWYE